MVKSNIENWLNNLREKPYKYNKNENKKIQQKVQEDTKKKQKKKP